MQFSKQCVHVHRPVKMMFARHVAMPHLSGCWRVFPIQLNFNAGATRSWNVVQLSESRESGHFVTDVGKARVFAKM
jgi:hypothetical protein